MRLRAPSLGLLAALLVLPVAAQTTFENEEDPFFIGRVGNSPIPARKTPPPPEGAASDPADGSDTARTLPRDGADGGGVGGADDPARTFPQGGRDGPATAAAGDAPRTTSPEGATIETRTLPAIVRPDDRRPAESAAGTRIRAAPSADGDADANADADADADGRIRAAPDAGPSGDRDDRFVRAPESRTFDPDRTESPGAPLPTPETELQRGATLRQLDKMTGQIVTFDIAVGQTMKVARLSVELDACRAPDDNDTHGTMAFLKISDTRHPEAGEMFSGWMFAESPALSALDHPRYDLWLINCTTVAGKTSAGNE